MPLRPCRDSLLLPFRNPGCGVPLRLGVASDSIPTAPWIEALVEFLRGVPGIELACFPARSSPPSSQRVPFPAARLLGASRTHRALFGTPRTGAIELDTIREAGCDALLWLAASLPVNEDARALARYGVFTVGFGDGTRAVPFWNELALAAPTGATRIDWWEHSFGTCRTAAAAETSVSCGPGGMPDASEAVTAAIRLCASIALDLQRGAGGFLDRLRLLPEQPAPLCAAPYPSTLEVAGAVARRAARGLAARRKTQGKVAQWFIAARPNQGQAAGGDFSGFRDVPCPEGSEGIADPFLAESGGRTWLFFEDLLRGRARARLACREWLGEGAWGEPQVVLEREDCHLSYPCVIASGGEFFLMPESREARSVDLYRFRRFPHDLELAASPAAGLGLVDTTPFCLDGRWYFFTTTHQPFLESFLFTAASLDGRWELHPASPISRSVRNSRGAGSLFWHQGRLYRPTQDCSLRYGYAVTINEVTRLTPTEFAEHATGWIGPSWRPGLIGTHTWNESSQLQVIDGMRLVRGTG
jgi:hypothetical protein